MNPNLTKAQKFFEKIAEISGMNDAEKNSYMSDLNEGLTLNIIVAGKDLVSPEIYQKLTSAMASKNQTETQTTVSAYLKEMNESEDGKKIINTKITEVVNETFTEIKEKLTSEQVSELQKILE